MPLDSPPPLRPENLPEIQHRPQPKNNWLLPTILIGTPIATLLFIICLAMFVVALVFRQLYIGELLHGLFGNGGTNSGQVVDCSGVTGVKIPQEYLPWIQDAAKKWMGGDEAALIAVIQHESSFQADAHNPGGATGLGQFMHDTAIGYNEFKGGDDGKGTVWSPGVLDGSGQDARYDPKRSIYATAHKFGAAMQHHNGNVGEAYEFDYHTVGRHNEYLAEALKGRADVERIYQQLKAGGGCHEVNSGGSNGGVTGGGNAANGGYLQVPGV